MDTVLDLPTVLERLDDDRDLLAELVQIFLRQVPAQLVSIGAAVKSADARALKEHAHALKGSAGNLGAVAVFEAAARLEQMGRDNNCASSEAAYATLKVEVDRLTSVLERFAERKAFS